MDMLVRRSLFLLASALALLGLVLFGLSCLVVVDETEYAIVTSFGDVAAVHGKEPGSAGLHFKRPWQSVLRVDRRLRAFDPPPREVITADKRNLEVGVVPGLSRGRSARLRPRRRLDGPGGGKAERAGCRGAQRRHRPPRPGRAGDHRSGEVVLDDLGKETLDAVAPRRERNWASRSSILACADSTIPWRFGRRSSS